jgi:hypothetical protein
LKAGPRFYGSSNKFFFGPSINSQLAESGHVIAEVGKRHVGAGKRLVEDLGWQAKRYL